MPDEIWRVLVIDDDQDICRQISEHYDDWERDDQRLEIKTISDFAQALATLERERFDLVILDVFQGPATMEAGDDQGKQVLGQVKQQRFIPIIFYTALPRAVTALKNVLVKVAEKSGSGFATLDESVREYLALPLLRINRELARHFDETLREYMWKHVPKQWDEIAATGEDDATLAYLLCRRIAASLDLNGAERLAQRLRANTSLVRGTAHPLRYYILPPELDGYRTGDLLKEADDSYWIVLTPWCDLVHHGDSPPKAEYVLLVRADPLSSYPQYTAWTENDSNTRTKNLKRVLGLPDSTPSGKQAGRHYFLPGAFDLPDLVLDMQQTKTNLYAGMSDFTKIATLDSPYAEAVVSSYTRFISRLGTPDLDIDAVLTTLRAKIVR